ncbi:lipopolysaccharide heptosyltransferase family protein [Candidatus Pelagibacter sp.]|nr:lipopolysaccharide heptosyltransferase family protein [Candidatus Pelagibacter sp.]|tara:strand:+ start:705 stop:1631 length:927 start_codon:yes stop_codon:yes gene_type:complete
MKTGIFLSYSGLGANLLHLSYCHQIAKKYGPLTLITLNSKLKDILQQDPNFNEIIYLDKFHKRLKDIFKLSKFLKDLKFNNLFIFYPSLRYFLSSKLAGIKNVYQYPIFKKKKLHLVQAAKLFTERNLNILDCPTETKIFFKDKENDNIIKKDQKIIILGIGSSGQTTKWGVDNFSLLISRLSQIKKFYFYLLCGPQEKNDAKKIIEKVGKNNCESLDDKSIFEVLSYISKSDFYIGNDSFGHHISCQMGKPSFIILLDTPRAYSDYSINQYRILPENVNIDEISHNSNLSPNSISVDMILNKIEKFI